MSSIKVKFVPSQAIKMLVRAIRTNELDIDGVAKYCALADLTCLDKFVQKLIIQQEKQLNEERVIK